MVYKMVSDYRQNITTQPYLRLGLVICSGESPLPSKLCVYMSVTLQECKYAWYIHYSKFATFIMLQILRAMTKSFLYDKYTKSNSCRRWYSNANKAIHVGIVYCYICLWSLSRLGKYKYIQSTYAKRQMKVLLYSWSWLYRAHWCDVSATTI